MICKYNRYYLDYSVSSERMFSDFKRSFKSLRYWRIVEWRFRLKKAIKRSSFTMSFRHVGFFTDIVYDDEWRIENIANYYGYDMIDETLLSKKSIYKFVLKKSKNP